MGNDRKLLAGVLIAVAIVVAVAFQIFSPKMIATIETEKGTIVARLEPDFAPQTVANFVDLAKSGFYDGLTFHRVEPEFVIQGGDPAGNGTGGSGKMIPLEIADKSGTIHTGKIIDSPVKLPHTDGALAMARSVTPDSASSQFYFTIGEQPFLDGKYAVFGRATKGLDVIRLIERGDKIISITISE